MRLKYLSLCLIGLSLSACSSHVIKTNHHVATNLEQRAANALNAMYEYPSYDYNGKFNIVFEKDQAKANTSQQQDQALDRDIKKQVDRYLTTNKIQLSHQQKQDLYTAIANKDSAPTVGKSKAFENVAINFLNSLQFSYDGSVHYKEKIASLNLTAQYEKPTLLVQAKVPMIVDFKNYKFYTNYFGLMPYLVNQESQDHFAYFDFSKYKDLVDQVDLKKLAEYWKQSSILPYALAQSHNIQAISVSEQDHKQAVVEKIRLNTSVEELFLQMRLYDKVNSQYLKQTILGLDASAIATGNQALAAIQADNQYEYQTAAMSAGQAEAYRSSKALYALVNAQFSTVEEAETASAEIHEHAVDVATQEQVTEHTDQADATSAQNTYITQAECEALQASPRQAVMGDITYCGAEYDIDVLNTQKTMPETVQKSLVFSTQVTQLDQLFEQYAQPKQLVDAQHFKALWTKHLPEIRQVLIKEQQSNPFVMDVGLDQKGRAVRVDYDVAYWMQGFGRVKFKADLNAFNYGKATAINQNDLKNAKSIQEMSKGSLLENMAKSMGKSMGLPEETFSTTAATKSPKTIALEPQLEQLAIRVYDASHSYMKTYQAVFIMQLTAEKPELVKQYSITELNEIAQVYAYSYAGEMVFQPTGKALADLQRLAKKHHLEYDVQFADDIGAKVYEIVFHVIEDSKQRQDWRQLVQQYKQPQAIFAQYYYVQFTKDQDQDLSSEEKVLLKSTAQVLAKAFDDSRKDQLTAKSIQNLKAESSEYIDYDLYRTTYEKVQQQFEK